MVWLSRVFTLTTSYPARQVRSCPSEQHGRVRRDVRRRLRTERFDLSPKRPRRAALPRPGASPTMIRLQPRASDGVAEPRLRSLDPGRASERLPPAARLPCSRCQGCGRQIWHTYYYFFSFFFPTSTTPCVDVEPVRRSQDPWQDCAVLFCHQRLPRRGCL